MPTQRELDTIRINELEKVEWRDIYFHFRPTATEQDFEVAWTAFITLKSQMEAIRAAH